MKYTVIPIPQHLQPYVALIRRAEHEGDEGVSINVCVNGLPGIVFQTYQGASPIESISTRAGHLTDTPTLSVYGQMMLPGVMQYKKVPFTTTQIVLKPHALQTLLGINAASLTNSMIALDEFAPRDLNEQLLEAQSEDERTRLLINFLSAQLRQAKNPDTLVEESLRVIHSNVSCVTVKYLLEYLNISERQFEKRFSQAVGLPPQFYIRVKRFNEAIYLMQTRGFVRLTDVAHRLNYYDQSHFIRDIKEFSGITPKSLSQKVADFQREQPVIAY